MIGSPRASVALLAVATLALAAGCSKKTVDPEQEIRETVMLAAKAATERELKVLKSLVASEYKDSRGQDKQSVVGTLNIYYLRRSGDLYVVPQITDLKVIGEDRAEVAVVAALARTPVKVVEELEGVRADIVRFDLKMKRGDDHWLVTGAEYSRARLGDLLDSAR